MARKTKEGWGPETLISECVLLAKEKKEKKKKKKKVGTWQDGFQLFVHIGKDCAASG